MKMVETGQVYQIIIAHKDRLVRFGFEWFDQFCRDHGCEILVINDVSVSPEHELVQDLMEIVHVFSCRLYGLRRYKKALKKALKDDSQP